MRRRLVVGSAAATGWWPSADGYRWWFAGTVRMPWDRIDYVRRRYGPRNAMIAGSFARSTTASGESPAAFTVATGITY
jgi:hypothetical protein